MAGAEVFIINFNLEGQATAIRDTIAAVAAVGEKGIGTFCWEPAYIQNHIGEKLSAAELFVCARPFPYRLGALLAAAP
ncbi:MAG: hypothetical protein HFH49_12965 [Lachnospiraceae bacterium]|nr:hypothetical protein [Lachnospiraceae bacterium]